MEKSESGKKPKQPKPPEWPRLEWYEDFDFPPVSAASPEGIVCWGGNLSPGMLVSAYSRGIFPWYSPGEPILWWSPDPRFVLAPEELHISASMGRVLKKGEFQVTFNQDFEAVIRACGSTPRPGQNGTWVTEELVQGYGELHRLGYAHSVEVRRQGKLVGGLFGELFGGIFFGESMFSWESNASKTGFLTLVPHLVRKGVKLIDCQVETKHLASLGAKNIPRKDFLRLLADLFEAGEGLHPDKFKESPLGR